MALLLDGIRVVEVTEYAFGPGACQMMADMGAEVLKIEDPEGGDYLRAATVRAEKPPPYNSMFEFHNRNKKSLAIDLTKPEGRQAVHELVKKSDIFVVCLRAPVVRRLGLDYATLSSLNPKLIYAQGTPFGPKGPLADLPGLDFLAIARVGFQDFLAQNPGGVPPSMHAFVVDRVGSLFMAYAIMQALYHRERTGEGQEVQVSLLGAAVLVGTQPIGQILATGEKFPRPDRKKRVSPLAGTFRCKDDRWIQVSQGRLTERVWADWCTALGVEHLISQYDTLEKRLADADKLGALFDEIFATKPRDEWMERFSHFPPMLMAPINTYYEAAHDPQLKANDFIIDVTHPKAGPTKMVGFLHSLSKCAPRLDSLAPELGQHTEEVLLDLLGYDWDRIAALKEKGAIA